MRRRAPPFILVTLLALHGFFSIVPALTSLRTDFANYYVSARIIRSGGAIDRAYERDWFQTEVRRAGIEGLASFIPHPPANALLLLPFAGQPPPVAKALWTTTLVLALVATFIALLRLLPIPATLLVLAFLLPSSSLANALAYGQPYPWLLLLLALALWALVRRLEFTAGLLLAPLLVLKLYAAPFALFFAWTRRGRALLGLVTGVGVLLVVSVAVLGAPIHAAYLREILPASLKGEIQDPYSTIWGSLTSLAHRLFQHEPDLNPHPVADLPFLAAALSRGLPIAVVALAVIVAGHAVDPRRAWAVLTLGLLAASPLTASYHFVLLILPVAVMLSEATARQARAETVLVLGLHAFVTSPAPHYFAGFASGWGNLLAYPRLAAVLLLLGLCARDGPWRRALVGALTLGALASLTVTPIHGEEPWKRVEAAQGYLMAEPVACGDGLAWVTTGDDRLVIQRSDGTVLSGPSDLVYPKCADGRLTASSEAASAPEDPAFFDRAHGVLVFVDVANGMLRERLPGGLEKTLAVGRTRYPRLSPDGERVVYQSWEGGSWDIRVVLRHSGRSVRVTADAANEVEPRWMPSGHAIVFASDRRRGLGSTAIYTVPFAP